jgi:hypothetical protein
MEYYNKAGLCELLNYHAYYTKGQPRNQQIICSEDNLKSIEELIMKNEIFIQETIYQLSMVVAVKNNEMFGVEFG